MRTILEISTIHNDAVIKINGQVVKSIDFDKTIERNSKIEKEYDIKLQKITDEYMNKLKELLFDLKSEF